MYHDSYIAHVKKDDNENWQVHSLLEHLQKVGLLAGDMAAAWNATDWAELAGRWHDLGK